MRKNILYLLLLCSLTATLPSCQKYEDGPWISFRKAENRIRGIWELSSVYKNGEKTATETPSEVESPDGTWELYKSVTVLITYYQNNSILKSNGSWEFNDNKTILNTTFTSRYAVVSRKYKILRLTQKEMKLQYTDEQGTQWVLNFSVIQSFAGYEY
jgi:hypothetical protein